MCIPWGAQTRRPHLPSRAHALVRAPATRVFQGVDVSILRDEPRLPQRGEEVALSSAAVLSGGCAEAGVEEGVTLRLRGRAMHSPKPLEHQHVLAFADCPSLPT